MAAGIFNLEVEQGATYEMTVTLRYRDPVDPGPDTNPNYLDFDITDYTPHAHIRRSYKDSLPTITMNTSKIVGTSKVYIEVTPEMTTALGVPAPSYVWDLELHHDVSGKVIRVLKGECDISPEATKP